MALAVDEGLGPGVVEGEPPGRWFGVVVAGIAGDQPVGAAVTDIGDGDRGVARAVVVHDGTDVGARG